MLAWWFGLVVWKSGKSDVTAKKISNNRLN